jgi:hypothetical protein
MPLQELVPGSNAARDDVQQNTLSYDVLGRYVCNTWQEVSAAQGPGGYPFERACTALIVPRSYIAWERPRL